LQLLVDHSHVQAFAYIKPAVPLSKSLIDGCGLSEHQTVGDSHPRTTKPLRESQALIENHHHFLALQSIPSHRHSRARGRDFNFQYLFFSCEA
jgi:hypothetical protein